MNSTPFFPFCYLERGMTSRRGMVSSVICSWDFFSQPQPLALPQGKFGSSLSFSVDRRPFALLDFSRSSFVERATNDEVVQIKGETAQQQPQREYYQSHQTQTIQFQPPQPDQTQHYLHRPHRRAKPRPATSSLWTHPSLPIILAHPDLPPLAARPRPRSKRALRRLRDRFVLLSPFSPS